jgi:hypothetical protein
VKVLAFRLIFAGNSLLAIFIFSVLFAIFPLKITQPIWLYAFADSFLSNSGFSLVALISLILATYFDPDNLQLVAHVRKVQRLACVAAICFLFLIPLNFYIAYKFVTSFRDQQTAEYNLNMTRVKFFSDKVDGASTFDQLQEVMKTYQAIQLPEQERLKPLERIKNEIKSKIKEAIVTLQANKKTFAITQKSWEQYLAAVRNSLFAFTYFLAFAAFAQRRNSQESWLQEMMNGSLNRLYKGLHHRESRVAFAAEPADVLSPARPLAPENLSALHRQGLIDRGWLDDQSNNPSDSEAGFAHFDQNSAPEPSTPTNFAASGSGLFPWIRSRDRRRQDEPTSFLEALADEQAGLSHEPDDSHESADNTRLAIQQPLVDDRTSQGQVRPGPVSRRQRITDLDYFEQLAEEDQDHPTPHQNETKPPS